ncbi:hypothetical protein VaNZ11_009713 [Volvox africanus]|uniref:Uncharacterized protein n=1 Tax=Volvox africanus TaxID=51714 RepID=A0ABQ5S7X7_9CHLO|nr:hypothetical protein VaNZ11_009713 [Volvox africanus]
MRHRLRFLLRSQSYSGLSCSYGLLTVLLAMVVQIHLCQGATMHPHPNCDGPCDETNRMCRSTTCDKAWDSCMPGTVQNTSWMEANTNSNDCYWTECTPGGCPEGFEQIGKELCFDVKQCPQHVGVCNKEHCCPLEPRVECCKLLPCDVTYEGCQMPQHSFNTSTSVFLPHGSTTMSSFYTAAAVFMGGGTCDDVRVWGSCQCDDGRIRPGCELSNSSTWYLQTPGNPSESSTANPNGTLLPPDLSITCVAVPAEESATQGGSQQRHREGMPRGALVALIIIGCLLLAGCTAGVVLWCCGLLPDMHNLRIRSLTSYEPVFTGQSYTPSMGGSSSSRRRAPPSSSFYEDIPWTRFCAAVTEVSRRVLYGKRYIEESASAAAAAERYRTLNSLGRRRRGGGGGGVVAAPGDEEEPESTWPPGKVRPTLGQVGLTVYPSHRGKVLNDDDLGVDEVFTLDDLGANSGDAIMTAAWRPMGHQLPVSRSATAAAAGTLPPFFRAISGTSVATVQSPAGPFRGPSISSTTGTATATAAAAGLNVRSAGGRTCSSTTATPSEHSRQRLNQFGLSKDLGNDDDGKVYGGGHDVIHTRPLVLGDSGVEEDAVPPDVDAPLRWLPSPQVTGQ